MDTKESLSFESIFSSLNGRTTEMKIGGTVYEVSTHFNLEGRQNVLQQFAELIADNNLISKSA